MNTWVRLCSNKTLLSKVGGRGRLVHWLWLADPDLLAIGSRTLLLLLE